MSTKRVEQLHAQGLRTRACLLDVAREVFEECHDASLNSIAKRAGVGIGTLYRHFPTREELVFELYRDQVQRLVLASEELLRTHPPLEAFRLWMERFARYAMTKAGLMEVLRTATAHGRFAQEARGPVTGAVEQLLAANREAGTLREDLTADDVLLAVAGLYQLDPSAEDWEQRAHRLLELVLCGLRRRD
ncbi:TetR/AcrR family transcriptional regulator [Nocardiopsis sp. MG754419]|uniref:TetR/AcrR family transcriptional regulator n=1 Tax=Nocardiopsis sp. MG754419 TaxID=2259865 RepID=UPI001BA94378|nr:TetR/AcrR family transcriptional regulator [Nocardiopsis sp. MG754419]MBR8744761.1 TetR/AcrR family transcriptional regulator [Nocardiopsis sp. MG754419]